jgi:hypothetical protein
MRALVHPSLSKKHCTMKTIFTTALLLLASTTAVVAQNVSDKKEHQLRFVIDLGAGYNDGNTGFASGVGGTMTFGKHLYAGLYSSALLRKVEASSLTRTSEASLLFGYTSTRANGSFFSAGTGIGFGKGLYTGHLLYIIPDYSFWGFGGGSGTPVYEKIPFTYINVPLRLEYVHAFSKNAGLGINLTGNLHKRPVMNLGVTLCFGRLR